MNISLKEQLSNMNEEAEAKEYPYVRRDQTVRARILAETGENYLIETIFGKNGDTLKRTVTKEYFDNNYWEGKT